MNIIISASLEGNRSSDHGGRRVFIPECIGACFNLDEEFIAGCEWKNVFKMIEDIDELM